MLNDATHGQMWLQFVDKDAYSNNLLHVCVELHNIDFAKIILDIDREKNTCLLGHKNSQGLTPFELLEKENTKAKTELNPEKKEKKLELLSILNSLFDQRK